MQLLLPSSTQLFCIDRFSLLDSDLDVVPFWDILKATISDIATNTISLIDQLEIIAITLRGTAGTDFGFLGSFIDSQTRFFSHVWPKIVSLALEMPVLFPSGALSSLMEYNTEISFSRKQVACLVIHQFLCSIPAQPWKTDSSPDFRVWYSSGQPHPKAVNAYLTALFTYFERLAENPSLFEAEWPVSFSMHSLSETAVLHQEPFLDRGFAPLVVTRLSEATTDPRYLGLPNGAAVISANKNVGFGPSGTQEETHVGSSPEACPVVLLTPTLRPADIMVVRGVEAMVSIVGYGREARLQTTFSNHNGLSGGLPWRSRTMLFMDALELDECDPDGGLPDLLHDHVDRELQKAYTAFSSGLYTTVFTGLWGCRSFAGNPQIKTIIQWCAASLAGVPLNFVCSAQQEDFVVHLDYFVTMVMAREWKVGSLLRILREMDPHHDDARNVFRHIEKKFEIAYVNF